MLYHNLNIITYTSSSMSPYSISLYTYLSNYHHTPSPSNTLMLIHALSPMLLTLPYAPINLLSIPSTLITLICHLLTTVSYYYYHSISISIPNTHSTSTVDYSFICLIHNPNYSCRLSIILMLNSPPVISCSYSPNPNTEIYCHLSPYPCPLYLYVT